MEKNPFFNEDEVVLLLQLVKKYPQVHTSRVDAAAIKEKAAAWEMITEDFNDINHIQRDTNCLKVKFRGVKSKYKWRKAAEKREMAKTGRKTKPAPTGRRTIVNNEAQDILESILRDLEEGVFEDMLLNADVDLDGIVSRLAFFSYLLLDTSIQICLKENWYFGCVLFSLRQHVLHEMFLVIFLESINTILRLLYPALALSSCYWKGVINLLVVTSNLQNYIINNKILTLKISQAVETPQKSICFKSMWHTPLCQQLSMPTKKARENTLFDYREKNQSE